MSNLIFEKAGDVNTASSYILEAKNDMRDPFYGYWN